MCDQDVMVAMNKIVDNYPGGELYGRLTEAARRAVMTGMATGVTLHDYREARRGRGREHEFVEVVGDYVRDELRDYIHEEMPEGVLRHVLLDLLDLSSYDMQVQLGEHYLPDPDDLGPDDEDDD